MKQPDALKVQTWKIERVKAFADNARLHPEEQIISLMASVKSFGFVNPVLVDANDECVAGHGRILALKRLGHKTIPVIVLGHLTPEQVRAYRIADNQLPDGKLVGRGAAAP